MKFTKYIAYIFLLVCIAFPATSQEIKLKVNVNLDRINYDSRVGLNNFSSEVENYVNSQRFLDEEWEGDPIPVEINAIFSHAERKNRYKVTMLINANRLLDGKEDELAYSSSVQFYEAEWEFEYNNGGNLYLSLTKYDELSTMLNFYMLMVIGFDMDTYQASGGNPAFEKARNLAILASNEKALGFDIRKDAANFTKYSLVNEILDMRMQEVRRLIFAYYVNGMDKIAFNHDEAVVEISHILNDLAIYKRDKLMLQNHLISIFFETKHNELASLFNGFADKAVFENLKYLDPTNTAQYNKAAEGTFLDKQ